MTLFSPPAQQTVSSGQQGAEGGDHSDGESAATQFAHGPIPLVAPMATGAPGPSASEQAFGDGPSGYVGAGGAGLPDADPSGARMHHDPDAKSQQTHAGAEYGGGAPRQSASTDRSLSRSKPADGLEAQRSVAAATIKVEHDQAVLNHAMNEAALRDVDRDIEKAKATGDEDKLTRLEAQRAKLAEPQKTLEKTISQTTSDLALLDNPGASQAELNQMFARRNAAGSTAATTTTTVDNNELRSLTGPGKLNPDGTPKATQIDRTETRETTSTVNDAAITKIATDSRSVDTQGAHWGNSSSTRIDSDKDTWSSNKSTQNQAGFTKDVGLGYTRTKDQNESLTTDDVTSSSGTKTTTQAGLGGFTQTQDTTNTVDDYQHKDTHTKNLTRGDGKIGMGGSSSSSVGTIDKDSGAVTNGNTNTRSGEGHLQVGQDGFGLGGSGSAGRQNVTEILKHEKKDDDISNPSAREIKTGMSVTGDGHVTISVKKYEGEDEQLKDRFVIVVSVHLGANIGGSADGGMKWNEQDGSKQQEGAIGGGVDGSVKAAADLSYQHVMSADECKEYLAQLGAVNAANAGNGKYPELAQISAAWRDGWRGGAGAAINTMRAAALNSPDAIRKMPDGDKIEFSVTGSADGQAHLDANGGGFSLGAHAGVGKGGTIKFTLAKVHDELLVTGAIDVDTDWSAGGSAGAGGLKGSYDHSDKQKDGTSVTFHLNPDEVDIKSEILAARTRADLENLAKKYPKLLKEHEVSTSDTKSDTFGLEYGKAKLELGNSANQSQTITTDADGKQTQKDTGSNKYGGSAGYGDYKYSDSQTDSIQTKVGPDNKAQGDLSTTTVKSDVTKSLLDWQDRGNQQSAVGKATDSNKFKMEDSTDQSGMFLSDADYNTIIGAASDPGTWNAHAISNRNRDDWHTLGAEIRSAQGDKKKVGEALKKFVGASDHDRQAMVEAVVRKPLGSGEGGSLYDFPEGLGNLKAQYQALVFNDPTTKANALYAAHKEVEAATEAKSKIDALDMLYNQISSAQTKFQETGKIAAYGEMLHNIGERKNQLSAYIKASDRDKAVTRYEQLRSNCVRYQQQEQATYQKITDLDRHNVPEITKLENELRALYLKWDPEYNEMSDLGSAWLFDEKVWSKLKPDRYRFDQTTKHDVNPTGKTLDEQLADQTADRREAAMNAHMPLTDTSAVWHKVYQEQNATARDAAAHTQRGAIAEAKHRAAIAAQWHNTAVRDHQSVAPAAAWKAGAGWSKWSAATEAESRFAYVASNEAAVPEAVDNAAKKAIDLFAEAEALFKAGHALNHQAAPAPDAQTTAAPKTQQ